MEKNSDFLPDDLTGINTYPINLSQFPKKTWLSVLHMRPRTCFFPDSHEIKLQARNNETFLVWGSADMIRKIKNYEPQKEDKEIYVKYFGLETNVRGTRHVFDFILY